MALVVHEKTAGHSADKGSLLEALYRRAGPVAHGLALAITGDPAAAEDVVHEAVVRVAERLTALEDAASLDGYLVRTARNLALDLQKRSQAGERAQRAAAAALLRRKRGGSGELDVERLGRALFALPPEQREVVVLRVWEGWTAAQVSERLAIPAGTVHSRYRLALERLRGSLLEGRP